MQQITHTEKRGFRTARFRAEAATTIGQLEPLAGIGGDRDSRFAFWIGFRTEQDVISAGASELHRRIADRVHRGELSLLDGALRQDVLRRVGL